eukprot:5480118-Alexandrium_andersonii.AAC.1
MPELKVVMGRCRQAGGTTFALMGDVSKAHRRVKVRRADHCHMVCSLRPGFLWVNQVGSFGLASAAYWWGRIAAAISRSALYLQGRRSLWQLLFADDFLWAIANGAVFLPLGVHLLWLVCLGMPFSWRKFRGGWQGDWIGFWLDWQRFEVGLSATRTGWLLKWLRELESGKATLVQTYLESVGRL